jgi:hypothetical protein
LHFVRQLQLEDSARIGVALGHLFVVDLDLIGAVRRQTQHEDFLVLVKNGLKFLGVLSEKNCAGIEPRIVSKERPVPSSNDLGRRFQTCPFKRVCA